MANYEMAEFGTGDKDLFKKLESHFQKEENHFDFYESIDGRICVRNRHGYTMADLKVFSSLNKGVQISAIFSFESERYGLEHKYVIENGVSRFLYSAESIES